MEPESVRVSTHTPPASSDVPTNDSPAGPEKSSSTKTVPKTVPVKQQVQIKRTRLSLFNIFLQ